MPLDGYLMLDDWPSTLIDCQQWVELASRAEFEKRAAFAVGVRDHKVVAWQLNDARRDVKTLTEVARENPRVKDEFQRGYAYFLHSINQPRHRQKAQLIASELARERDLGQPLTSRRILGVAEFLDSDMPTLPLLDDPDALESARKTAMRQAHAAFTACSAGERRGEGRTTTTTTPRRARAPDFRVDGAAIHHGSPGKTPKTRTRQTPLQAWQAFRCWCTTHGQQALPASDLTIAAYLKHRAKSLPAANLYETREVIAQVHAQAGHPNKFNSKLLEQTLGQLKGKEPIFAPKHLNAVAVAAIRTNALNCRQYASGMESEHIALHRGTMDIAIYSLLQATSMSPETAALLEWRHFGKTDDGTAKVLIPNRDSQSLDACHIITLPSQVYREVEALREDAGLCDKVFGITGSAIRYRITVAAKWAGLKAPLRW